MTVAYCVKSFCFQMSQVTDSFCILLCPEVFMLETLIVMKYYCILIVVVVSKDIV